MGWVTAAVVLANPAGSAAALVIRRDRAAAVREQGEGDEEEEDEGPLLRVDAREM